MKKIKKIATSIGVLGKILNAKSDSTENAYSCDYLNNQLSNKLTFMDEEIFKNKNYNDLEVGIYKMNTWTGVGGSNYPAENLLGSLIVLKNAQITITKVGIYIRVNDGSWSSWMKIS